ncbi:MAG: type II toxin-antitoxin system VapC family toxin [Acidimicrobiales bacterium]
MILVDARVLMGHFDSSDIHHRAATSLLGRAVEESGRDPLGASPITVAEVLVGPARSGRLAAARSALEDLGVVTLNLPADAGPRLALMRAETGMRIPDCCVLLAAVSTRCAVATFDAQLGAAARRLGVAVLEP